ncbi:MAG: hypothetical protein Q9216_002289 [Gyalolechia sp. 2 TL-2023]
MVPSVNCRSFDPIKHKPLPSNIDAIAVETPNRPFLSIPCGDDGQSGWRDISYYEFSRAVNRCAWWLKQEIGESSSFETLSYIGPHDATLLILLLACVKTGWNALSSSPSASVEDRLVLFEASHCKFLLHPVETPPMVLSILQKRQMSDKVVPQLDEWLLDSPVPHFPFTKTLSEAWKDPFALVHSSGTTGNPKLIQLTHGSVATAARLQKTPGDRPTLFHLWRGLRVLLAIPISIAAGIFTMLSINVEFGWIVVLAPTVRPTAKLFDRIHQDANVQVAASLPTVYPDLTANADYLDNLSHLRYVAYTGGPCPSHLGARIASKTRLVTLLGSSETGPIPTEATDPEDWEYTKFSAVIPHRLTNVLADLHELEIVREGELDSGCSSTTEMNPEPVFSTLPGLTVYGTKDLYSKHPIKADLWRFRGRKDDLITLSPSTSSEPSHMFPVPMEEAINCRPEIKSALIMGNGKPRPALLAEPNEQWTEEEQSIRAQKLVQDVIWPVVAEVNLDYPSHTRLDRGMVKVLAPGESMPTTSKGYVSRKLANQKYQALLDSLYAAG